MEVTNQDPAIDRQPKKNDPQEVNIRQGLQNQLESTNWAKSIFEQLRQKQITFFQFAENHLNEPESIRQKDIELVKELATTGNSKIVEGEENLARVDPNQSIIVVTNHLGTAKLTAFSPNSL
jgi:hypothetical protein